MWYDSETKTIYYYSEQSILYANENAGYMFSYLAELEDLDISTIRTKYTKNMDKSNNFAAKFF